MNPEISLSHHMNLSDIRRIAKWAISSEENRDCLWRIAQTGDRQASVNALWVMTHLPSTESEWLYSRQAEFTDMLLKEKDAAKKRMLLQLLRNQPHRSDDIRIDLLDYCLSKINSECETYAVRAFSIYVAFKICRHYPELFSELHEHLAMLSQQALTPGLSCARRKTLAAINGLHGRQV